MRRLQAIKLIMSVLAVFLILTLNSESYGQSSANQVGSSSPKAQSATSSDTYAPVGPTGYKILIPEIKMNRIIGNSKPRLPVTVPPESTLPESASDESVEKETPKQPSELSEQLKAEEPSESEAMLPFDHRHNKPAIPIDKEDSSKGFLIAVSLILATGTAFRVGNSYVVIKDKNGVCRVIKASKRTPSTIAGPFNSKEVAQRAKEKERPKASAQLSLPACNYIQLSLPVRRSRRSVTRVASATGRHVNSNVTLLRAPTSNIDALEKMVIVKGEQATQNNESKRSGEEARRL